MIKLNKKAFTLIEVMIATAVFSIALLILMTSYISMNQTYYKGIAQSDVQNATRNILNDVAQSIEFSSGNYQELPNNGQTTGYCIGNNQYDYILGARYEQNASASSGNEPNGLIKINNCSVGTPDLTQTGLLSSSSCLTNSCQELLSPGMRVVNLSIIQNPSNPSLFNINIKVAFGANDLFCDSSKPNNCSSSNNTMLTSFDIPTLACKTGSGSQFCAVSQLSTTVASRYN